MNKWKRLFMYYIQHPVQQEGQFLQLGWGIVGIEVYIWIPDPRIGGLHWECDLIDCLLHTRHIAICFVFLFFLYSLMTMIAQM